MNKVSIARLGDNIHIKINDGSDFFYSDGKSVLIISLSNLAIILKFLLFKGLVSHKVLEGILSEYYDYKQIE